MDLPVDVCVELMCCRASSGSSRVATGAMMATVATTTAIRPDVPGNGRTLEQPSGAAVSVVRDPSIEAS